MYRVLLAFTYHERAICDEGFGIGALGGGVSDGVFLVGEPPRRAPSGEREVPPLCRDCAAVHSHYIFCLLKRTVCGPWLN